MQGGSPSRMRQTSRFIFRRTGSLLVLLVLLLVLLLLLLLSVLLLLLMEVELLSSSSSSSASTTFLSRVDVHMCEGRDRMSIWFNSLSRKLLLSQLPAASVTKDFQCVFQQEKISKIWQFPTYLKITAVFFVVVLLNHINPSSPFSPPPSPSPNSEHEKFIINHWTLLIRNNM